MVPPVLETERLILRLPEERDFEAWAAFKADPESTRFLGGVQSRAAAWRALASIVGSWSLRGCGFFAVEEKGSGRWVGHVGPWYPEGWPGREIGWSIAPEFQRRGYAREAAVAAIDFAFDELGWAEVIHCIDPDNLPSIRLAERLGSRLRRRGVDLPPFDVSVDVYGQSCAEWRSHRPGAAARPRRDR